MSGLKKVKYSSDGERAAVGGYQPQYEISASIILQHLRNGTLEWIKLTDPAAGSIDDFQIATPGRLDAYQIKWSQHSGNLTYSYFTSASKDKESPLHQLATGWKKLCQINTGRRVIVHWLTNDQASTNDSANIPTDSTKPTPCHFSAFLEQVLYPVKSNSLEILCIPKEWKSAWENWLNASQLDNQKQVAFLHHCELDLRFTRPAKRTVHSADDKQAINQIRQLTDWLIEVVADPKKQIQFFPKDILAALGISELTGYSQKQDFPIDERAYRPIENTILKIEELIKNSKRGYIALIGSPGSGKSTLLTQYLRYKPIRLARYYAYVPDTRDVSVLRGESTAFLSSIISQFDSLGYTAGQALQTNDRETLLQRFKSQIELLHNEYKQDGKIAIILIDGLDHIHRELKPVRSLLADLPRPEEIPEGVFICLGSQTINLPDLPSSIRQDIYNTGKLVTIAPLSRKHIFEIIDTIGLPFKAESSVFDQIYELSGGHPLALRYLLQKLQKAQDKDTADIILRNNAVWQGDIELHYETYWNQIQPKDEIVEFLGLISRIPGSINLKWVNSWPETTVLRKVDEHFGYLFKKESSIKWTLFHNSFRLFLIHKTRQLQPGLEPEKCDQYYHKKLAQYCENQTDASELSWNKIYHLERSAEYQKVLKNLTQDSLREQFLSLRPRYSIWEDIYAGLKSTAVLQDPVALMRLILAGQELESRGEALGFSKIDIPKVLINIGEYEKALLHIRDGHQLLVNESAGLEYACQLFDLGQTMEAAEILELSEPIEYLSGTTVLKVHPGQNNTNIFKRWVKTAIRFRSLSSILSVIPNIRVSQDTWNKELEQRDPSEEIRNEIYITLGKELVFLQRYDDFNVLLDYIDKNRSEAFDIGFKLLRILYEDSIYDPNKPHVKRQIFNNIVSLSKEQSLHTWQRLWLAKELIKSNEDKKRIEELISDIPLLQPFDSYFSTNHRPLDYLSWDMIHVAIKRYLGENTDLIHLVPDATDSKHKGSVLYRRAIAAIGRIFGSFWKGEILSDITLRQTYLPVIKLFYQDWDADREWLDWHSYRSDSGRLFEYLIEAIYLYGDKNIESLKETFEKEWDGEYTKKYWYHHTSRTVILALWTAGISKTWAIDRLEKLESNMLIGHDTSGRMDELSEQINAWLELGEFERVRKLLITSLNSTFGIGYRKDYQLNCWIKWYRNIAKPVPDKALKRYQRIAETIPSLESSTEGQTSAAILLIESIFDISPMKAVMLFVHFWKLRIISYQDGINSLIKGALYSDQSNLKSIISIYRNLLIPISKTVPEEITKSIISKNFTLNGRSDTIDLCRGIINTIDVLALSHIRPSLHYTIAQSLQNCGITEINIANAPEPLLAGDRYATTDRTILELKNGNKMTSIQVVNAISNAQDLIGLFEGEEQYRHFDWISIIKLIFNKLSVKETELLIKYLNEKPKSWELLNVLAEQFVRKDDANRAHEILSLSIQHIKNGNGYFYDRANRLDTFALLKKVNKDEAIKEVYSFIESELVDTGATYIFRSTSGALNNIFEIICEDVPYAELGNEIDNYIQALFANEQETGISFFNEEIQDDSVNRAIADLVCESLDHDVSIICQLARNILIECIWANIPEYINAANEKLSEGSATISILIAILEASKMSGKNIGKLTSIIQQLAEDTNIVTAQIAQDIAINMGIEVSPIIPPKKITLPPIYSLVINENQAWDILYGGDLKEDDELPDTQDPRELVKPNGLILKAASKESGIPFINLCMRAVRIVQEKGQESLLKRSLEKEIKRRLDYTGLRMTYRRPRFRAMDPAIQEVVGELAKAGRVSSHFLALFKKIFHPYDPAFIMTSPEKRPEDISPITGTGDRISDMKDWVAKSPDSYVPEKIMDGFIIVGEDADIRKLVYGIPFENRITACMLGENHNQKDLLFGRLCDCNAQDYLCYDFYDGHGCLVVRNDSYKIETGQVSWMAFNPLIARDLNWEIKTGSWFHWIDNNGNTMAKSIWWKDGLIQWYDTHFRENSVEVGEGWRVVVSSEAITQIKQRYGKLIRKNRLTRVCHQDNGTKHENIYEQDIAM